MADLARWNLAVSRETDDAVRSLLAERGRRRGDLSRYVEEAVARRMLLETIEEVRAQNAHRDPDELMKMIDEELAEVRRLNPDRYRR